MTSHPSVLTTSAAVADFCAELAQHTHVAIDTEFMRETTYYAKLCLIQISGGGKAMAIDPLARGIDLSPLFDLFANPDVIKVFHAGRQDIEIFFTMAGVLPTPVYDTQIAAMVCGFGEQVGYDRLIKGMLGVHLDKASRFTDWEQRPLTEQQINYALDDVIYLDQVFPIMRERMKTQGREGWLAEELHDITNPSLYQSDPEDAWHRIKQRSSKPQVLNRLKHLAAWREREVQRRDMPRSRLIRDETLVALAESNPAKRAAFDRIRGFPGGSGSRLIDPILAVLGQAAETPKEDWPPSYKQTRRQPPQAVLELLRVLLKHCAEEADVAPRLIATADDLERMACGEDDGIPAFSNWRLEIFGRHARDLIEGRLALTAKGESITLIPLKDSGGSKDS